VRLARLQFDGGYSPYSTVLQAEQQLFPSELNYTQYRAALFISLVNIYKAMGGGWLVVSEGEMDPLLNGITKLRDMGMVMVIQ